MVRRLVFLVLLLSLTVWGEGRLESEFKLAVPEGRLEDVWRYLNTAYGPEGPLLTQLGTDFSATFATEEFLDRYFDTPQLRLAHLQSGLRHRTRYVLEGANRRKDGRQLVQLKTGTDDSSGVVREEKKFEVRNNPQKVKEDLDMVPGVGLTKRAERPVLLKELAALSIEPEQLSEVTALLQTRRRVYISRAGEPFATITLDHVVARRWIYLTSFDEMELELNEIAYTEADASQREEMTRINQAMKDDLFKTFPGLSQDQTPKYNKALARLKQEDPFFDTSLNWGFRPELFILGVVLLLCLPLLRRFFPIRRR